MKHIKNNIWILLAVTVLSSCDGFLDEKPLDFYSPENSMSTTEQFRSSLNYLYNRVRREVWEVSPDTRFALYYATDFAFNATDYYKPAKLNDYTSTMVPTFGVVADMWNELYDVITNANVIINRISSAEQVNVNERAEIEGEAKFFRAYAYRFLAHLYGGVPIQLEEITTPRRNYVRASREDVYRQAKQDLEDAIDVLPDIGTVADGKVSRQLAQHYLSEVNICLGLYDEAISAASAVIGYPEVSLMTDRFGSRKNEAGDVYWDLFRLDNQNRSSGNREGLWVLQYDYQNAGSSSSYNMMWALNPFYQNIQITEKDASGNDVKATAVVGVSDGKGGRSIGWMQPTKHFFNDIWEHGSENDIRNSEYNIVRDLRIDNPNSPAVGKWLVKDGYVSQVDSIRLWYPMITKFSRISNVPEDFWLKDASGNPRVTIYGEHLVQNGCNASYKDEYLVRLAETYLLRAEAYIMKGDKDNAAKDINVVRARAHADPVLASEVDIDYLLDERMRELYGEEMRMVTLCRMGKLVERNKRYNPKTGATIQDYHNLWPIPYSEIERNTEAVIEQNPGYVK
jgi:hypothetical protein